MRQNPLVWQIAQKGLGIAGSVIQLPRIVPLTIRDDSMKQRPVTTSYSTSLLLTVPKLDLKRKQSGSSIKGMQQRSGLNFATVRHAELFDELISLFLAEGFTHLTLDEIAARLKCSKSTLYMLSGSKEQLVRAATVHFFRRETITIDAKVSATSGSRKRIAAYVSAVGEALSVASEQFMADLSAFAPAREVYEQNIGIAAEKVQGLIMEGVTKGDFRQVHAAFAGDLVATMMMRIQQGSVRSHAGLDDAGAYRELATILTAGIGV